jgi:hypothetical protein
MGEIKMVDKWAHTTDELQTMISKMQGVSNWFYTHAQRTGCHAFLEFTGLMNEYITLCRAALSQGIDFTDTNVHGPGKALPMQSFHRDYLNEKLQCIYGVSLNALTKARPSEESADEQPARLRATWEEGLASLDEHGPQLETDEEFEAFLDECEAES